MIWNDRIKEARRLSKLTLEEVANRVGVSRQTIQKYESGVIANIPCDNIELIAKATNVSPAYLMGWEEAKPRVGNMLEESTTKYDESTSSAPKQDDLCNPETDPQLQEIIDIYCSSNDDGKEVIAKQVAMLGKIPDYKVRANRPNQTAKIGKIS
jgi:repressor LexA